MPQLGFFQRNCLFYVFLVFVDMFSKNKKNRWGGEGRVDGVWPIRVFPLFLDCLPYKTP